MQYTLVKIITPITTPAVPNSIPIVLSEKANASHLSNSLFKSYSNFASPS